MTQPKHSRNYVRRLSGIAAFLALLTMAPLAAQAQDDPFVVTVLGETAPSLPEGAPGYTANGSFEVSVEDGASCTGTIYDIVVTPVAASSPLGNTPPFTIPSVIFNATDAGSPYVFSQAGAGQYTVTVFEVGPCDPSVNPVVTMAIVPDGDYDDPFVVTIQNETATDLPESAPGYTQDGSFEVSIADGGSCPGTIYDIVAVPVVNSSPLGNTPSFTIPSVIFNATAAGSPYVFSQAGAGEYDISVFEVGACEQETNPETATAVVPEGEYDDPFAVGIQNISGPSQPEGVPEYQANGYFEVVITDGASCTGTSYDISITPVVGSSPLGNTPPPTIPSLILGATAAGSPYLISNAGAGEYDISVLEVGPCDQEVNPVGASVSIPNASVVPVPVDRPLALLLMILLLAAVGSRALQRRRVPAFAPQGKR